MKFNDNETRYCEICSSAIKRGTKSSDYPRTPPKQYAKARFCSRKCKGVHHAEVMRGKKNPNYVHGLSPLHSKLRGSVRYKKWREKVFRRDGWTCQDCGDKGKELNADHIKPFALFPELRFEISNGRTLCIDCHKKTPSYGRNFYHLKEMHHVL